MHRIAAAALLAIALRLTCAAANDSGAQIAKTGVWPMFRGQGGLATAADTNTSLAWDAATGQGIRWKTDLPLPGAGSPIVWNDRLFLSGAAEGQAAVFCFDTRSGKLLWRGEVPLTGRLQSCDEATTYAAPTPLTDGRRVFAVFATGAIAAFNLDGTPAWNANLGLPDMPYGYASSPALHKNLLLVQYDQAAEGASALIAFDTQSGKIAWQTKRSMGASWCSPIVIEAVQGPQVVAVSCGGVAAYDPKDGHEIWTVKADASDVTPSPVFSKGLVIASLGSSGTLAIRPDGRGDVTATHVAWRNENAGAEVASPVACGGWVFVPSFSMFCLNAADGKQAGERQLSGTFYASPIVAGDKLYLMNREGAVTVLKPDKTMAVLGKAAFGEPVDSTPAVAGGCLFVRTRKRLFCIQPAGSAAAKEERNVNSQQ